MNGVEDLPLEGSSSGKEELKQERSAEATYSERDSDTLELSSTIAPGAWALLPVQDLVEANLVARRLSRDQPQA